MDAKKCDRCGEFYSSDESTILKIRVEYFGKTYGFFDICPKCENAFNEWFNKKIFELWSIRK